MDFITDKSGRHLLRINSTVAVPDYVKQAAIDADAVAALPTTCFADQAHNEFPLNTPAHVFLSYCYCKSAGVTTPRILDRLKKAGAKMAIAADLEAIDQAFGAVKKASTVEDRKYAISIDFGDGVKAANVTGLQNFYPINNVLEIQDSAVELDNHKNRLPLSLYTSGAREIVKAARDMGLEARVLPERIRLYGADCFTDFDHVNTEAQRRIRQTGDSVYEVIAKSANLNEEQRPMDDYAKLWELADARNGVTYLKHTPDPYRIFNVGLDKSAYTKHLNQLVLLSGAVVPMAALAQVEPATIQKQFPKEAANAVLDLVKKAAEAASDDVMALAADLSKSVQKTLLRLIVTQ